MPPHRQLLRRLPRWRCCGSLFLLRFLLPWLQRGLPGKALLNFQAETSVVISVVAELRCLAIPSSLGQRLSLRRMPALFPLPST